MLLKHLYYFRRPYRCHSSNSSMFKWLNNASTHERKYISDERPSSSSDENTSHKIASHNEDDQESYRKVENQQKFEKK